jgi:hypothetical protein
VVKSRNGGVSAGQCLSPAIFRATSDERLRAANHMSINRTISLKRKTSTEMGLSLERPPHTSPGRFEFPTAPEA